MLEKLKVAVGVGTAEKCNCQLIFLKLVLMAFKIVFHLDFQGRCSKMEPFVLPVLYDPNLVTCLMTGVFDGDCVS